MQDTDDAKKKPDNSKSNAAVLYWVNWIKAAKTAAKDHKHLAQEAWREYLGEYRVTTSRATARQPRVYRFPLFWSSVQTIQPAFYSTTPTVIAEADFQEKDPIANTAAFIAERLGKYFVKINPFDRVLYDTRDDFILADKATNRVLFDTEKCECDHIAVFPKQLEDGTTVYVDGNGNTIPESAEIYEDDQGGQFYEQEKEEKCIKLVPISINDILHSPAARHWDEIDALAFRLTLTKRQCEAKFGAIANLLNYGKRRTADEKDPDKDLKEIDPVTEIYEIWDKQERVVRYVSEHLLQRFLKPIDAESDEVEDPYKLPGFFPCPPFVIGTKGPENLFPIPVYCQLEDIIKQLNGAYKRLCRTVRASRRRGIFDQNVPELATLQSDADEGEYIPVKGFAQLVGEKGLDNLVQHFPVDQLVSAMTEMMNAITTFKDYFYELSGIPDVLRGTSDPVETAEAQKIKERHASLRFSSKQRQFQELVRKDIELMVSLGLSVLDPEEIAELSGLRFADDDHQRNFPEALALLKTNKWRNIRISIETDSTILANEEAERRRRNELVTTVTGAIGQISQMEGLPEPLMQFLNELIIYSIGGLRDTKAIVGKLKQAIADANVPAEPPPPEPNIDAQKLELEKYKIDLDSMYKNKQLEIELQRDLDEVALKREELTIKAQELGVTSQLKQLEHNLEASRVASEQQLEQLRVQIEQQKVMLDEREKYMTEYRLQAEAARKERELALSQATQAPASQPLTIVNEAPKPVKKKYRIVRDALGNADIQSEEIPG